MGTPFGLDVYDSMALAKTVGAIPGIMRQHQQDQDATETRKQNRELFKLQKQESILKLEKAGYEAKVAHGSAEAKIASLKKQMQAKDAQNDAILRRFQVDESDRAIDKWMQTTDPTVFNGNAALLKQFGAEQVLGGLDINSTDTEKQPLINGVLNMLSEEGTTAAGRSGQGSAGVNKATPNAAGTNYYDDDREMYDAEAIKRRFVILKTKEGMDVRDMTRLVAATGYTKRASAKARKATLEGLEVAQKAADVGKANRANAPKTPWQTKNAIDIKAAFEVPADKRNPYQKYLVEKSEAEVTKSLSPEERVRRTAGEIQTLLKQENRQPTNSEQAMLDYAGQLSGKRTSDIAGTKADTANTEAKTELTEEQTNKTHEEFRSLAAKNIHLPEKLQRENAILKQEYQKLKNSNETFDADFTMRVAKHNAEISSLDANTTLTKGRTDSILETLRTQQLTNDKLPLKLQRENNILYNKYIEGKNNNEVFDTRFVMEVAKHNADIANITSQIKARERAADHKTASLKQTKNLEELKAKQDPALQAAELLKQSKTRRLSDTERNQLLNNIKKNQGADAAKTMGVRLAKQNMDRANFLTTLPKAINQLSQEEKLDRRAVLDQPNKINTDKEIKDYSEMLDLGIISLGVDDSEVGVFDDKAESWSKKLLGGTTTDARAALKQFQVVKLKLLSGAAVNPEEFARISVALGGEGKDASDLLSKMTISLKASMKRLEHERGKDPYYFHALYGREYNKVKRAVYKAEISLAMTRMQDDPTVSVLSPLEKSIVAKRLVAKKSPQLLDFMGPRVFDISKYSQQQLSAAERRVDSIIPKPKAQRQQQQAPVQPAAPAPDATTDTGKHKKSLGAHFN